MLNINMESLVVYLLVFVRFVGMLLLNPIFLRRSIPNTAKVALVLALSIIISPTVDASFINAQSDIYMIVALLYEFFIGVLFNFMFQIFYYMLFTAGDLMDFHFGLSMAKVFDPATSIQMSASGTILNILFVLNFFAYDCHLLIIKIIHSSFELLPLGSLALSGDFVQYGLDVFVSVFSLTIKLAVPFVAFEFVMEMALGILMKLIPQIHIFVVNIQLKIMTALLLLLIFAAPLSEFLDKYLISMFQAMQRMVEIIAG